MDHNLHDHDHEHIHEHTHADGTTHTHSHSHDDTHDHSHTHGEDSMKELTVLMRYMVSHNKSHADELKELAEELKHKGLEEAYNEVLEAIKEFDKGNSLLSNALSKLEE